MSFNVRLIAYRGILQIPIVLPQQFNAQSVFVLNEPYEWSQVLATNGATPILSAPETAQGQVNLLRVEVPDGQAIRYEVQNSAVARVPGTGSPILSGHDHFFFQPGWVFALVDAASFP